ncbi:hypothetical protein, partial [Salmonella enterica]|uniref:hypothetical protein n=1 Tax=Salmonella enterica TaxID=28901 RepID=UPI0039B4857C
PALLDNVNDGCGGGKQIIGQIFDEFCPLRLAEITLRAAVFGLQFFFTQQVVEVMTDRRFVDTLKLSDHSC